MMKYTPPVRRLIAPITRETRADPATATAVLSEHFLRSINARIGTHVEGLDAEARRILLAYDWPGNVRELENTLEHAAVLAEGAQIGPDDLPERLRRQRRAAAEGPAEIGFSLHFSDDDLSVKRAARRLERELILRALEHTAGNRTHAAKLLDLSHRALLYKIKDYELG
jgi:two-component system response regulator AtoC